MAGVLAEIVVVITMDVTLYTAVFSIDTYTPFLT